ncbi:uncharacterized protein TRIADDRAFT_52687 [Trichoplax adhaerens]|uniref:SEC63 domain-containing protein n=1 Tax=Trichoplax adhaerens TaxID=10228 RepID=B3RJV1_TRIAD|nr:hypothetical protein TRIADDRAFT_52687 [Trichoplax adhaerens]EDV29848.1 hypothetical protein TRIADDRAFT_52687 [Trichoplax adhaerens]|eukprot:XP_002109050.1 hypothetical protein TRIADDRAFT_52687 [Trichoplax adhaerens]
MAKNSLSLETMKILMKASNENTMAVMIMTISKCPEFGEIQLRKGEKKDLNNLNQSKGPQSIRLIQATFDSIAIPNYLAAETATILQTGRRLAKGNKYAAALVKAGLIKLDLIASANPSKIEALLSRRPPFGNQICDAAATFPRFAIDVKQKIDSHKERSCLTLSITVLNAKTLQRLNRNGIVPSTTLLVIGIGLDIHKRMKLAHAFQMSQPNCNGKNFQTEETLLAMSSNQLEKILSNNSSESKEILDIKGTTLIILLKILMLADKSLYLNITIIREQNQAQEVSPYGKSENYKNVVTCQSLEFQKYHIEQEDHGSCFTNLHQMYEAMD